MALSDCLRIILVLSVGCVWSLPISYGEAASPISANVKVNVSLYYETLCPSCRRFIGDELSQAVFDLEPIIRLALHPFGNAKLGPNGNVTCQHGPEECRINMIQACLLTFVPDIEALPAIKCMEMGVLPPEKSAWWCIPRHAPLGPRTWELTQHCMSTTMGQDLILLQAKETMQLQPPHKFTPWVTVNGVPALDDYHNVGKLICDAYLGASKPEACSKYQATLTDDQTKNTQEGKNKAAPKSGQKEEGNAVLGTHAGVCMRNDAKNVTILYTHCAIVKVLGEACMYLYQDLDNESLGILFDIPSRGFEVDIPLGKERECMTDASLLLLLDMVPQLQPYKKAIKELIAVRGFIPGDIYSECVRLYNVTVGPAKGEIAGCLALDSNIMCWKEKCLHKGETDFGCFHHNKTSVL